MSKPEAGAPGYPVADFHPDVLDQLPQVTQVVTFQYALSHLDELADQVQRDEERIAVMRDGVESLQRSHEEALAGDGVSLEELKREFGYGDADRLPDM